MKTYTKKFEHRVRKSALGFFVAILLVVTGRNQDASAAQVDIPGPPGSGTFGASVFVLPNGNLLVADPTWNGPEPQDESLGAVYLYDGITLSLISKLTGSSPHDSVGSSVTLLSNGNFLVLSPYWANAPANAAGAVTWGSQDVGVSGVVSAANSLVGTTANDQVGSGRIIRLSNGNYVVSSPLWNDGAKARVGAVTWGNGLSGGLVGAVGSANSLIGGRTGDQIGLSEVIELPNGNYVVSSAYWANGTQIAAGAVTLCSGSTGRVGVVSAVNSLVGGAANDLVGSGGITVLSNGNYVVKSSIWNNSRGAITWVSGTTGIVGLVSEANSLVGSTVNDQVGNYGVTPLANGNYVVASDRWDNIAVVDAGAVTWGNGASGVKGLVSAANSLVGSRAGDRVGYRDILVRRGPVVPLANGNYLVHSPLWANGNAAYAGAVTWGNGTTGVKGTISAANSLVGGKADDAVGVVGSGANGVVALANGHYAVGSYWWDSGSIADAGAVTWGDGNVGVKGLISAANSLVGSRTSDQIGSGGITALRNGNYVVLSPEWDNGTMVGVGAVTWGNGASGVKGAVSPVNSLIGGSIGDRVGSGRVIALPNGAFVALSSNWKNGTTSFAGAATWGNGTFALTGLVSSANSLVGTMEGDFVGTSVSVLAGGDYVVRSPLWNAYAGAVTWGSAQTGVRGPVTFGNSVWGSPPEQVGNTVRVLQDGNYAIVSPAWNEGRGAVRVLSGTNASFGYFSEWDSLVGNAIDEGPGIGIVGDFSGDFVVKSSNWDNGAIANAGAVTLIRGLSGPVGTISSANSIVGNITDAGRFMRMAYDPSNARLYVVDSLANRISIFSHPVPLRSRIHDPQLRYADPFRLSFNPLSDAEDYAVYARAEGSFDPALRLLDHATSAVLSTNQSSVPGGGAEQVVLFLTYENSRSYEVHVRGADPAQSGSYEVALYAVARPGSVIVSSLNSTCRSVTNRLGSPAGSQWFVEDYLVQDFGEGEMLDVSVESTNFDGYVEVLDLRTEEVLAFNNDAVGGGTNARVSFKIRSGSNYVVRATSYQPSATGSYTLRVRPVLPLGYRLAGQLGAGDQLAAAGENYYDDYTLKLQGAPGGELAVYALAKSGYTPQLRLYDPLTETTISTANSLSGSSDQFLLLFTNQPGQSYSAQVFSVEPNATGDYEIGLYPVVRPWQAVSGELTAAGPVDAVQGAGYYARDYLLWEMSRGQTVKLRLESAGFDGKLEVVSVSQPTNLLITAEPGSGGSGAAQVEFTHQGGNYLVRVTSGTVNQTGSYRLVVERKLPRVDGFSPSGTNVGGTVVLSGDFFPIDNRATTWVGFGGGVWAKPTSQNILSTNITVTVPVGAVSGPLTVTNLNGSFTSTETFQVKGVSPQIRAAGFGVGGQFGFELTGTAGSVVVIESTTNLTSPIQWQPLATNQITAEGTLSYTAAATSPARQQFYRVRIK